jgi:hypothetical protein
VLGVVLREKDENGRLKLSQPDPPAWVTDEFEGYKLYLWHQGITEPSDVKRLYGAYKERRRVAAAAARAAAAAVGQ